MLESQVTPLLTRVLGQYFRNINPADLRVSLWNGDVKLEQLELREDVLQTELQLPLKIVSGRVHQLAIHIPWTSLTSESVEVHIHSLEVSVTNPTSIEWGEVPEYSTASSSVSSTAASLLPDTEALFDEIAKEANKADNTATWNPLDMQNIWSKVAANVKISIDNMIVKYVTPVCVVSLMCKSVNVYSVNSSWERAGYLSPVGASKTVYRIADIDDVSIGLDAVREDGEVVYMEPMVTKANFTARIITHEKPSKIPVQIPEVSAMIRNAGERYVTLEHKNHSPSQPAVAVHVDLLCHKLKVTLSDAQYMMLFIMGYPPPWRPSSSTTDAKTKPPSPLSQPKPSSPTPVQQQQGWLSWMGDMVWGKPASPSPSSEPEISPITRLCTVFVATATRINFYCVDMSVCFVQTLGMYALDVTLYLGVNPNGAVRRALASIMLQGVWLESVNSQVACWTKGGVVNAWLSGAIDGNNDVVFGHIGRGHGQLDVSDFVCQSLFGKLSQVNDEESMDEMAPVQTPKAPSKTPPISTVKAPLAMPLPLTTPKTLSVKPVYEPPATIKPKKLDFGTTSTKTSVTAVFPSASINFSVICSDYYPFTLLFEKDVVTKSRLAVDIDGIDLLYDDGVMSGLTAIFMPMDLGTLYYRYNAVLGKKLDAEMINKIVKDRWSSFPVMQVDARLSNVCIHFTRLAQPENLTPRQSIDSVYQYLPVPPATCVSLEFKELTIENMSKYPTSTSSLADFMHTTSTVTSSTLVFKLALVDRLYVVPPHGTLMRQYLPPPLAVTTLCPISQFVKVTVIHQQPLFYGCMYEPMCASPRIKVSFGPIRCNMYKYYWDVMLGAVSDLTRYVPALDPVLSKCSRSFVSKIPSLVQDSLRIKLVIGDMEMTYMNDSAGMDLSLSVLSLGMSLIFKDKETNIVYGNKDDVWVKLIARQPFSAMYGDKWYNLFTDGPRYLGMNLDEYEANALKLYERQPMVLLHMSSINCDLPYFSDAWSVTNKAYESTGLMASPGEPQQFEQLFKRFATSKYQLPIAWYDSKRPNKKPLATPGDTPVRIIDQSQFHIYAKQLLTTVLDIQIQPCAVTLVGGSKSHEYRVVTPSIIIQRTKESVMPSPLWPVTIRDAFIKMNVGKSECSIKNFRLVDYTGRPVIDNLSLGCSLDTSPIDTSDVSLKLSLDVYPGTVALDTEDMQFINMVIAYQKASECVIRTSSSSSLFLDTVPAAPATKQPPIPIEYSLNPQDMDGPTYQDVNMTAWPIKKIDYRVRVVLHAATYTLAKRFVLSLGDISATGSWQTNITSSNRVNDDIQNFCLTQQRDAEIVFAAWSVKDMRGIRGSVNIITVSKRFIGLVYNDRWVTDLSLHREAIGSSLRRMPSPNCGTHISEWYGAKSMLSDAVSSPSANVKATMGDIDVYADINSILDCIKSLDPLVAGSQTAQSPVAVQSLTTAVFGEVPLAVQVISSLPDIVLESGYVKIVLPLVDNDQLTVSFSSLSFDCAKAIDVSKFSGHVNGGTLMLNTRNLLPNWTLAVRGQVSPSHAVRARMSRSLQSNKIEGNPYPTALSVLMYADISPAFIIDISFDDLNVILKGVGSVIRKLNDGQAVNQVEQRSSVHEVLVSRALYPMTYIGFEGGFILRLPEVAVNVQLPKSDYTVASVTFKSFSLQQKVIPSTKIFSVSEAQRGGTAAFAKHFGASQRTVYVHNWNVVTNAKIDSFSVTVNSASVGICNVVRLMGNNASAFNCRIVENVQYKSDIECRQDIQVAFDIQKLSVCAWPQLLTVAQGLQLQLDNNHSPKTINTQTSVSETPVNSKASDVVWSANAAIQGIDIIAGLSLVPNDPYVEIGLGQMMVVVPSFDAATVTLTSVHCNTVVPSSLVLPLTKRRTFLSLVTNKESSLTTYVTPLLSSMSVTIESGYHNDTVTSMYCNVSTSPVTMHLCSNDLMYVLDRLTKAMPSTETAVTAQTPVVQSPSPSSSPRVITYSDDLATGRWNVVPFTNDELDVHDIAVDSRIVDEQTVSRIFWRYRDARTVTSIEWLPSTTKPPRVTSVDLWDTSCIRCTLHRYDAYIADHVTVMTMPFIDGKYSMPENVPSSTQWMIEFKHRSFCQCVTTPDLLKRIVNRMVVSTKVVIGTKQAFSLHVVIPSTNIIMSSVVRVNEPWRRIKQTLYVREDIVTLNFARSKISFETYPDLTTVARVDAKMFMTIRDRKSQHSVSLMTSTPVGAGYVSPSPVETSRSVPLLHVTAGKAVFHADEEVIYVGTMMANHVTNVSCFGGAPENILEAFSAPVAKRYVVTDMTYYVISNRTSLSWLFGQYDTDETLTLPAGGTVSYLPLVNANPSLHFSIGGAVVCWSERIDLNTSNSYAISVLNTKCVLNVDVTATRTTITMSGSHRVTNNLPFPLELTFPHYIFTDDSIKKTQCRSLVLSPGTSRSDFVLESGTVSVRISSDAVLDLSIPNGPDIGLKSQEGVYCPWMPVTCDSPNGEMLLMNFTASFEGRTRKHSCYVTNETVGHQFNLVWWPMATCVNYLPQTVNVKLLQDGIEVDDFVLNSGASYKCTYSSDVSPMMVMSEVADTRSMVVLSATGKIERPISKTMLEMKKRHSVKFSSGFMADIDMKHSSDSPSLSVKLSTSVTLHNTTDLVLYAARKDMINQVQELPPNSEVSLINGSSNMKLMIGSKGSGKQGVDWSIESIDLNGTATEPKMCVISHGDNTNIVLSVVVAANDGLFKIIVRPRVCVYNDSDGDIRIVRSDDHSITKIDQHSGVSLYKWGSNQGLRVSSGSVKSGWTSLMDVNASVGERILSRAPLYNDTVEDHMPIGYKVFWMSTTEIDGILSVTVFTEKQPLFYIVNETTYHIEVQDSTGSHDIFRLMAGKSSHYYPAEPSTNEKAGDLPIATIAIRKAQSALWSPPLEIATENSYTPFNDLRVIVNEAGPMRVIRLVTVVESDQVLTAKPSSSTFREAKANLTISAYFSSIALAVTCKTDRVTQLTLDMLLISHSLYNTGSMSRIQLGNYQLDAGQERYDHMVIIKPQAMTDVSPRSTSAVIDVAITMTSRHVPIYGYASSIRSVRLSLSPLELFVSDVWAYDFKGYIDTLVMSVYTVPIVVDNSNKKFIVPHYTPGPLFYAREFSISRLIIQASILANAPVYLSTDGSSVTLESISTSRLFAEYDKLGQAIGARYAADAVLSAPELMGSVAMLGNINGILRGVSRGLTDLVVYPLVGASRGPKSFLVGAANGVRSMVGHVTSAAFNSIAGLTGSAARNMDKLVSGPSEAKRAPDGLFSGIAHGLRDVSSGFVSGLSSAIRDPVVGAVNDGVLGFIKGVGRGGVRLVTKPIIGALEAVSDASHGVASVSSSLVYTSDKHLPKPWIARQVLPPNLDVYTVFMQPDYSDINKYANESIMAYYGRGT